VNDPRTAPPSEPSKPTGLAEPAESAERGEYLPPSAEHHPTFEGTYLPPQPEKNPAWKTAGAGAVGIGLLLAKFKGLLLVLLNLKWFALGAKVFVSSLGFLISIWLYTQFWGLKFAIVFVMLIFIHEMGHAISMRAFGVPASMPYFIPGFGALIQMKGRPASVLEEAYIALAGPLLGTVGALVCLGYGIATQSEFWVAASYTGFFLNLFNLFPVYPLDGGRVVGAISPRLWIFGLAGLIAVALVLHWWNPLLLILIVMSVPQILAAWRGQADPAYFKLSVLQRAGVAAAYTALIGLLIVLMLLSHIPVPAAVPT
jgi:Zn-dependent protease